MKKQYRDTLDEEDIKFDVPGIIERAKSIMSMKTDAQLANFLGVSRATVSNWHARNSIDLPLLMSRLYYVDLNWLLLDKPCHEAELNSLRQSNEELMEENKQYRRELEVQVLHHPKTPEPLEERGVRLFEINAAANLRTVLTDQQQYEVGTIDIPGIPRCDGALYVSGDSMDPLIKSGDIVGFRLINSFSSVIYGEIYLVSFSLDGDEHLVVKYVHTSELPDHIRLASYNPAHGPLDIPMASVNTLAIVKFSVRRYQMW